VVGLPLSYLKHFLQILPDLPLLDRLRAGGSRESK